MEAFTDTIPQFHEHPDHDDIKPQTSQGTSNVNDNVLGESNTIKYYQGDTPTQFNAFNATQYY